ncbi:MAG TPA: PQQ-dependent dehydrogenase, methanol/ethanol family [Gammaproteobacteria bacterium]|nr:PQQ-dependent dehydrogenase, methanol/ethanol family [Gammaproteobacteria bacterium]
MKATLCRLIAIAIAISVGPLGEAQPHSSSGNTGSEKLSEPRHGMHIIDDAALIDAAKSGNEWLSYGRDYAETRFSPLTQINSRNVGRLGLAWHYDTGSVRGLEATPLIANGVLYATTSWSNVFALDARTGKLLWRWDAHADRARGSRACCDVVNRGVALYKGKVYVGVIDGRLAALDARTGKPVWQVQTTPIDEPYTITGAPRVADGKVIIGNGGAELGTRGFISAYDAETGKLVWRFYIVPGDPSKPFESPALAAAAKTWKGEWWTMGGGGNPWDAIAYDPAAHLLYVGTGNGSPWNQNVRSPGGGDNLYLSSILALDVDTGRLAWYYQTTPGESWDYTAVQQLTLANLEIDGRERKVIMQAPKNGFFYVLDRLTGELLSAKPFAHISWASGIDMQTGRPIVTRQAHYGDALTRIAPGPGGAHNWYPMSYNPETGLVYLPASQSSYVYANDQQFEFHARAWNVGVSFGTHAGVPERPESEYSPGTGEPLGARSALLAWDPVTQQPRWRVLYENTSGGGTLTTAGNLVFQGTADGRFIAYSADRGQKLWEVQLGNGILAAPSTYEIDGKQYVSILVGWGGAGGLFGNNPAGQYMAQGRLWTFVLDGDRKIVPVRGISLPPPTRIDYRASPEQIAQGADLYGRRCSMCHGGGAKSGGSIVDLRYAPVAVLADFDHIVRGGAYLSLGMPVFPWFSNEELEALESYLLSRRDTAG